MLYSTLAAIFGSLFGFMIAAVAIVISVIHTPAFQDLRKGAHFPDLWNAFFGAIGWLAAATVAALIGLTADTDRHPHDYVLAFDIVVMAVAIGALTRSTTLLKVLVSLAK